MAHSHFLVDSPPVNPAQGEPAQGDSTQLETGLVLPTVAAYEALLPEIQAVPDEQMMQVNIDVLAAITTVTGVLPELRALRSEIGSNLPSFNLEQFDKLEQYTLALMHAHTLYRRSFTPKEGLAALASELNVVRDDMMANAASLARMKLINGAQLTSLKTIPGYRALASDLLTLCSAFMDDWPNVVGKTPFTLEELHRIGRRALELLGAVGLRDQAPVTTAEATVIRHKAFTLFLRAYEQARRAVHYLREEDGESIAPSLYLNRTRRRTPQAPETAGATPEMLATAEESVTAEPTAPGSRAPRRSSSAPPPAPFVIDDGSGLPIGESPLRS